MSNRFSVMLCFALIMLSSLSVTPQIEIIEAAGALQIGDWIQYEVSITPILTGEITPTLIKLDFINIEASIATVQTRIQLSDGNKITDVGPINIETGSNTGFIIPANTSVTDHVFIHGFGNLSIATETTSIYTGVDRLIVSAHYTNATHSLHIIWDKQTGMMLEQDITLYDSTTFMKILDTTIWQTQFSTALLYQIAIVIAIASVGLLLVRYFRKRK
ncbi:MAG: hypothetical protein NWE83_03130 [Candidatus Bathyarchaeota archaeon]|nr:hypothetical protein [Candidatus Bathyarchaeota archaeon]